VTALPLLHIGYHKTGTTWLQSGLFRAPGFALPWPSGIIRDVLIRPTDFTFDADRAAEFFTPASAAAASDNRIPVLSDERLSGSPHAGGYDSATIAARLASTFPEGRVLIVIREQSTAIYSMYMQYVRDGGGATLARYLAPRNPFEVPQFRYSHYEYDHLIARYRCLFGPERVLVLAYEDLTRDPLGFCTRIAHFAGSEPPSEPPAGRRYSSLSALTLLLKRPFNRLLVRNSLSPAAPFYVKDHERRFEAIEQLVPRFLSRPLERRWRAEVDAHIGQRFATSNAQTAALTGLDLAALGYPVAEVEAGPRG